jgi:flagellar biosynthesis anti-sigma factor FlgM
MNINSNSPAIHLNAYVSQVRQQQQTAESATAQATTGQADTVNLSDQAREAQKAVQSLQNTSDVRTDKVEKVKMEVDKGTYKVVGAQVATDMLRESLENNLVLQKVNSRV